MTRGTSHPKDLDKKIGVSRPACQRPVASALPSCGDFDIRIARDGTWYYRGSPIGRKPLVKLFSTVLQRDDDGAFWLVTPVERGRVVVEDAPFTAVEVSVEGKDAAQVLKFRNNVDDWVTAGPAHPIRVAIAPGSGEPSPYILIRDRLEALILRAVYYRLVDLAVARRHEGEDTLGLWSNGIFFPLDRLD